ncbi:MAG TPA: 50S ribosomal protein L11 methyltransferase [Pseudogracilibacillus sp.]|nr:50S ribosomal protein L11 methyltransferase [Pseudogracilibacillus sp.]
MSWIEVKINTERKAEGAVSNVLNEAGANGVVIEDLADVTKEKTSRFGEVIEIDTSRYPKEGIHIIAYFYENEYWSAKKAALKEKLNALSSDEVSLGDWTWREKTVQEEDWANEWKKYFNVQPITDTLTIVPSWESSTTVTGKTILMDPGMAFGTGTHPTTILSAQALEKYMRHQDVVIDVGTGSGVLSIAACKLGAAHVYAYDLDEVAVSSATMNRNLNELEDRITVESNDLLRHVTQSADVIVANILAEIVVELVEDAKENLQPGGYFITSGIIDKKETLVINKLKEAGFHIKEVTSLDHWITIIAEKEE